ncbi:MAG: condensation domain-containing protein [Cyanobacteria bacterium J06642_11]
MENQDLKQRIMALSPSQRANLAQRLSPASTPQRLVAYIVSKSATADTHSLKSLLKSRLPNYMVPAAIVTLETLPRTANGKIDVNALPAPQFSSAKHTEEQPPRTEIEATLIHIWQEVLKLDTIGIHDNFFELGGDSILSIQIVSRAREAGLRLAPNQLFESPTVVELATVVNGAPEVVATQALVTGQVPLTPIQQWFFEQKMAASHHWHQAMLVELPNVKKDTLQAAINQLWHHHDALRMQFNGHQQINADASQPPELIQLDLAHLGELEQQTAVANYGDGLHCHTNLTQGGLLQAALFNRGENQPPWLLLSAHHLIIDAVSWQILLEDLSKLLNGTSQLVEKTTSFKTWAEILVNQTAVRQSEANFWFAQAERDSIQLPRDSSEMHTPIEGTAKTVIVSLGTGETQALLKTVPAVYNTQINDALLTALGQTLLQWVNLSTGTVRLDIEAHGREQIADGIDLSRTVGWFTTTYPVSFHIDTADSCVELLKSVKEQLRQVPHRGIGYGMLRYLSDATTRQRLSQSVPSEVSFCCPK